MRTVAIVKCSRLGKNKAIKSLWKDITGDVDEVMIVDSGNRNTNNHQLIKVEELKKRRMRSGQ